MMALQLSNSLFFRHKKSHFRNSCYARVSASLDSGVERVASAKPASVCFEESRARIVKLIEKPELSISTYDTAWVAMVPSPHSSHEEPCFPDCVNWLLDNQCDDGSWARPHHHSFLQKDVLSSTLACVLALKRWGVGEEQIHRGVHFIELNLASATEKDQISPVGFDLIFPGMLEYASELTLNLNLEPTILNDLIYKRNLELKRVHFIELNLASTTEKDQISPVGFDLIFPGMLEYARELTLNLNLEPTIQNDLIYKRNLELKRCFRSHSTGMGAYVAYLSEGMGKLQDWKSVMKYKRRNGSLFNSPSTTAAAYIFHRDAGCLDYLQSALKKFGNAVPAVCPLHIYSQLCVVDNLQKLGISQYFRNEIQRVLDETFRCWLQGEEEIFMDASTCALAFRILRMNGYDVTSDQITKILEEECHSSFLGGHARDIYRTLESYRATEVIFPDEAALEKQNVRLRRVLEQELSDSAINSIELGKYIEDEVQHALQNPFYAIMERIGTRRNIEHYNSDNTRILKTSFCSPNLANNDFLLLSLADFNECQKLHRKELEELERWVADNRLDELKFARRKSAYCYFSAAATCFSPDLSDARMSWAKNGVLTTVVDDFFDIGGSVEELKNLIQLVEAWDVNIDTECSSQNVLIIFSALKSTICEIGDRAFKRQERCVMKHIIDIWLDLLNSMLKETEWARDKSIPTVDEYMSNAYVSFALGPIVLPALYLVGPKLSEEMVQDSEYHSLFKFMSTCGRLLNDIQGYERELKQGKLNAVLLYKMKGSGDATEEAVIAELKKFIENLRRELLRLVGDGKNSVLPRACKDLFWHMSTVLHLFYSKDDGFSSEDLIKVVKNIIYEPIVLDEL